MYLIFVTTCVVVAVKHGLGQTYNQQSTHPYFMGGHGQFRFDPRSLTLTKRQFQDFPFSPFGGGVDSQNGRFEGGMGKTSNFPPNYYDHQGSQSISAASLASTSSSPLQPSSFYSGYYYMQDKPSRLPQPSPYVSDLVIENQSPPNPLHSSLSMTPAQLHSVVVRQPPPPPPPLHQYAPIRNHQNHYPRLPGFPPSTTRPASMGTYQEALDLFSEVVHKLEKQPGVNGHGSAPSYNSYEPSPVSNGIYGSSLLTGGPPPGFPRHLDHIMGPDFLQRAQRLYSKIIKEQNERVVSSPSSPPPQKYPMYHGQGSRSGFQHGNYVPYYENLVHPPSAPQYHSYGRPSYLARNMNLDPFINSPLVEAVKSIEIPIGRRDDELSGEMMQMSESIQAPVTHNQVGLVPPSHYYMPPTQTPLAPVSTVPPAAPPPQPPMVQNPVGINHQQGQAQSYQDSPGVPIPQLDFPKPIPISENDYVEHPLPYDEYEGLLKDMAINHNYKK